MRLLGAALLTAMTGVLVCGSARADWVPPVKGNDTGGIISYSVVRIRQIFSALAIDHCARYGKVVKFLGAQAYPGGYISFACRWVPYGAGSAPAADALLSPPLWVNSAFAANFLQQTLQAKLPIKNFLVRLSPAIQRGSEWQIRAMIPPTELAMRRSLGFSICALMLLASAPALAASVEMPIRKAGLWEIHMQHEGTKLPDVAIQQCTSEAVDREFTSDFAARGQAELHEKRYPENRDRLRRRIRSAPGVARP